MGTIQGQKTSVVLRNVGERRTGPKKGRGEIAEEV